jgi:hypothetical protein
MTTVTIDQQIACVKRELAQRRRVYPRWVQSGQFGYTQQKADQEIAGMEAVLATLERVKSENEAKTAPALDLGDWPLPS